MLPIEKAYEIVGGISAMARHFNVTPWAVSKWRERVPAERCAKIEELTKGKIKKSDLRPDLWQ